MELKTIWAWLNDPKNQKTLAFLGGALVVVWAAYHKTGDGPKPPNPASTTTQPAATQPVANPAPGNANNDGQQQGGNK